MRCSSSLRLAASRSVPRIWTMTRVSLPLFWPRVRRPWPSRRWRRRSASSTLRKAATWNTKSYRGAPFVAAWGLAGAAVFSEAGWAAPLGALPQAASPLSEGLLKGLDGQALEIVARYSYVGLNDIVSGERYVLGRDQYYPDGVLADYPATSLSIGGGNMHSATLGVNYAFNKFAQFMVSYTYNMLDRDKYAYDENFHTIQARLMFQF